MTNPDDFIDNVVARANEICRRDFGDNASEMARSIGWTQSRLSKVLNKVQATADPYMKLVQALGGKLGYSESELTSTQPLSKNGKETAKGRLPARAGGAGLAIRQLFSENVNLTVYTEVRASAGSGTIIYDESSRVEIEVPRRFLSNLLGFAPPAALGVMFCDGDSMSPTFEDGDMLLYEPIPTINGSGNYALIIDGYLTVKRVQRIGGGGYKVISENKAAGYEDERYVPDDEGQLVNADTRLPVDFHVVGKVLWPRREANRLHVQQVGEMIKAFMSSGIITTGQGLRG